MMFRSYNNTSEYFFKECAATAMAILKTCDKNLLFSRVKISCYLHV